MDDLNKALNYLFGFKVPIDDYDEFEKKVEEARELKEHLDKVELLKDMPQIVTPVKMTNYDCIKSMSVEEMAAFIVKSKKIFVEDAYKGISETLNKQKKFKGCSIEIDNSKVEDWEKEEFEIQIQWLLQEKKENDR